MKRTKAKEILDEMVMDVGLKTHCLSVAIVMEAMALQTGQNPDDFWVAGLLHDADWEQFPEQHPKVIVDRLHDLGESDIAHSISAHGTTWGVEYRTVMDRSLVAVDELTGLIYANAKVRPQGLTGMSVKSVMKKFNHRAFAKGVDRDEIKRAVAILGVTIEELSKFIIAVLQCNAGKLSFPENESLVVVPNIRIASHPNINFNCASEPVTKNVKSVKADSGFKKQSNGTKTKRSEQELVRLDKRNTLINQGINPYPSATFDVTVKANAVTNGDVKVESLVKVGGRILIERKQGKACFVELQDGSGLVQLYFNLGTNGPLTSKQVQLFKKYVERGDHIGVTGTVFQTKTGVHTIMVENFELLCKSIRPLPVVKTSVSESGERITHDAVTNPELKYRQRYVDLAVNSDVRKVFRNRTKIVDVLRSVFNEHDFLEVQTPILQPIYGGAAAKPFTTHHNTLDQTLYLRIANELYLKRLIVGGFERVYEFSVDFRNEGMSRFHNPEFTQVEAYIAMKDFRWMMDFVEELIEKVAMTIHGTTKVETFGTIVNFQRPWKRVTMRDAILEKVNIDIAVMDEDELRLAAVSAGITLDNTVVGKGKLVDEIFSSTVEPDLIQPTFITEYPVELSPLAKRMENDPSLTERFEGFVCGKEFCNAFSELNDPVDQRTRFEEQLVLSKRGDDEAMMLDEDFLRALEYGMPPTAGLGLGIDRLCMIMLNQTSIQDVIFFPQMKPEK